MNINIRGVLNGLFDKISFFKIRLLFGCKVFGKWIILDS